MKLIKKGPINGPLIGEFICKSLAIAVSKHGLSIVFEGPGLSALAHLTIDTV